MSKRERQKVKEELFYRARGHTSIPRFTPQGQVVPAPAQSSARVTMGDQGNWLMDIAPSHEFHEEEGQVSISDPPLDRTSAEMVLEAMTPVVGGIAAQVNSLGQRVDILGRVGQTAENCFSLYEERLHRTEGEVLSLKSRVKRLSLMSVKS